MKIYMDGHPLLGNKKGIGRYTDNLVKEFNNQGLPINLITNEILNKKRLNSINHGNNRYEGALINNKYYPYKLIRRLMNHNVLYDFPIDMFVSKENRKDMIFHATNFVTLPSKYAKQVITIHDLAFIKYPDVLEDNIYKYLIRWVPYSINKADQIIAVSNQTKMDILNYFDVEESKVNVVYSAAEEKFKKQTSHNISIVSKKYNLPNKYILYIGTLEPKKNVVTLIEAYKILKQRFSVREKLVIVGAKGWKYGPIFERVKELNLQNDVLFTGYISDEALPAIYSGASVFVFPSIYEGFGIPLLEAMQCEVPVIASNTSCIPEVVEDSAIIIDPLDIEAWAENINKVIYNNELRKDLITKGINRASKFSWEKVAKETLKVYEKSLKG